MLDSISITLKIQILIVENLDGPVGAFYVVIDRSKWLSTKGSCCQPELIFCTTFEAKFTICSGIDSKS